MSELNLMQRLLKVQEELKPVVKDSTNPHFRASYFDINGLLAEVKPLLTKHGLFMTQALGIDVINDVPYNVLNTEIYNVDNPEESIDSVIKMPEESNPQKVGSMITYYRRYSLQSLLGLEAEDDDANTASGHTPKLSSTNSF
jgi:hypothetical protein